MYDKFIQPFLNRFRDTLYIYTIPHVISGNPEKSQKNHLGFSSANPGTLIGPLPGTCVCRTSPAGPSPCSPPRCPLGRDP